MTGKETIIFSGGGTLGSVSPLLAVYTRWKQAQPGLRFVWIGTRDGIEEELIRQYHIPFIPIFSGKLRRYFSLYNLLDMCYVALGFFQSIGIIVKYRPALMVSAGGYVSAPLHFAGWLLRVKSVIHQQDLDIGLANRLMAPYATRIFVALPEGLNHFKNPLTKHKTVVVGNPAREEMLRYTRAEGVHHLKLDDTLPVALIFGGGQGAAAINRLVEKSLGQLVQFVQVVHITGQGKDSESTKELAKKYERYHPYTFVKEAMAYAMAAADVVVSRAGFATLSELSAIGKAALIMPIPDSHQEKNVAFFAARKAIEVLNERTVSSDSFAQAIRELIDDEERREQLSRNINAVFIDTSGEKFIEELEKVLE
ncbi:MAG: UDP-N-acetylglucosamine--N-acetylmuramyl-(pentapeptide) pyrophosphoryl-undecaprenol N-acetylglucosamine transferase [Patescibacteria group bacterium]